MSKSKKILRELRVQTQLLTEASIADDDAFNWGWHDGVNNNIDDISINEDGTVTWQWNNRYLSPRLQSAYNRGLEAAVPPVIEKQHMINAVRTAGVTLSRVTIVHPNNNAISTTFSSYISKSVDENTGAVIYTMHNYFEDRDLADAYTQGFNEGVAIVDVIENTPEQCAQRLGEITAQQHKEEVEKCLSNAAILLLWLSVPFILYFFWHWIFFFAAVVFGVREAFR